jgi:hypothetical protein
MHEQQRSLLGLFSKLCRGLGSRVSEAEGLVDPLMFVGFHLSDEKMALGWFTRPFSLAGLKAWKQG